MLLEDLYLFNIILQPKHKALKLSWRLLFVFESQRGNRMERDHWGDLGVDGWIILGWISRRWDVGIWTGLG